MKLQLQGTRVLERNLQALSNPAVRIVVNEGGTGSSKTYSLSQLLAILMYKEAGVKIEIVRSQMPALKATAMRDFFTILKEKGLYDVNKHNKTDHVYTNGNGTTVSFLSVDDQQKMRGRRRDYLYINEANDLTQEEWRQLSMRTTKKIFLDYNPSDFEGWYYDIQSRPDCQVIHSTYLDNPFLPMEVVHEIEGYKDVDANYYQVYALGLRGNPQAAIYTHWKLCDEIPAAADRAYGLDFGFNNKTALDELGVLDNDLYFREVLYESKLTNGDLIKKLKGWKQLTELEQAEWVKGGHTRAEIQDEQLVPYDKPIYADAAEPQRIEEIRQAGFWIIAADKDVLKGIDTIKSRRMFIVKDSVNLLKEVKHYKWKEKDGKPLDEPVKVNDHHMDACRYVAHSHLKIAFVGFV